MNKKKVLIVMLVFVSVILMGCKGKGASSADGVSDAARAVIEAFMTCPNEDLYNDKMKGAIGVGTETISDEEWEKINAEYERVEKNWEKAIGEYFADNSLDKFINDGYVNRYLSAGKKMKVESMELLTKDDSTEKVKVTALVEDKEQEITVEFKYNSDGRIWKVNLIE